MDLFTLNVKSRKETGKGFARSLRRDGFIPATLYGLGVTPQNIIISAKELQEALKKKKTLELIINITVDGKKKRVTILRELQVNPVKDTYIHADFNIIDVKKPIIVSVPVEPVGVAIGVDAGGMLQTIRRELIAKCLPLKIPEKIEIDVSTMDIGHSVHIEDIAKQEEEIDFIYDVNFTVITCTAPTVEEPEPEEEEIDEEAEEESKEETEEKTEQS